MVRIGDVLQSQVSIRTSLRLREWSRDVETDYINGMNAYFLGRDNILMLLVSQKCWLTCVDA